MHSTHGTDKSANPRRILRTLCRGSGTVARVWIALCSLHESRPTLRSKTHMDEKRQIAIVRYPVDLEASRTNPVVANVNFHYLQIYCVI
jgi:hypothetical protein